MVFRKSWFRVGRSFDEQTGQVVRNATRLASSLHATSYRLSAYDIGLEDAGRAVRASFATRSLLTFGSQLGGQFSFLVIDCPPRGMAAVHVSADEKLPENHEVLLRWGTDPGASGQGDGVKMQ